MYLRLVAIGLLAVAGCSEAVLGDGPAESGASPDAAPPSADPDAGPATGGPDAAPPACQDPQTYYRDADTDGYGDPAAPADFCDGAPAGYVDDATDCDDTDREVHPAAAELCGDRIDNDCSGADACQAAQLAHWPFQQTVGGADASGNGHDAIARDGADVSGEAAVLDGHDDFFEVANDASFARAQGTVAVWFRADDLDDDMGLWSRDSAGLDGGGHLTLWATDGGDARVRIQSDSGTYDISAGDIDPDTDHHVVATFGPTGLRLYVDGAQVSSSNYAGGTTGNAEPIVIGAASHGSDDASATPISDPFDGRVYDARFYGRALSATEIGELFALTSPSP